MKNEDEINGQSGIASYAQRLKNLPSPVSSAPTSAPRYPGTIAALPDSVKANFGNEGRSIPMPKSLLPRPASPAVTAATPGQPAAPGLNVSQTSQPGINKVTGGGLNSPLYTNVGDAAEAVNGLKQPMNSAGQTVERPTLTPPWEAKADTARTLTLPPSFSRNSNSGNSTGMTIPYPFAKRDTQPESADRPSIPYPFAKTANPAGDAAAGMPEGLQRSANANAIRQSMIDAMPTTFGAGGSLPDQAEQINAQNRQRRREDELLSLAKNNPQVASVAGQVLSGGAQRDVEDKRQGGLAASLGLQVRGQDLNRESQLGQQALASRSLDLNNARDNARLSLDQQRFGLEQQASMSQIAAREALAKATASGDPRAIAQARAQATALGIKVEPQANLQHVETDRGTMVFDPRTGAMTPAVGADGQPVGSGKALTEYQGKSTGFGMRADAASKIIDQVGQGGKVQPSLLKRAAEAVPLVGEGLGMMANSLQSPEQQQVEQAQRDFVNAVLRQESGAAISQSEFDNARKQYFPQPGDSQEVVAQKQANREAAINGFRVSAGPGARNIGAQPQQAEQAARQPQPAQQPAAPAIGTVDGGYVFLGGNPNDQSNWVEVRK